MGPRVGHSFNKSTSSISHNREKKYQCLIRSLLMLFKLWLRLLFSQTSKDFVQVFSQAEYCSWLDLTFPGIAQDQRSPFLGFQSVSQNSQKWYFSVTLAGLVCTQVIQEKLQNPNLSKESEKRHNRFWEMVQRRYEPVWSSKWLNIIFAGRQQTTQGTI